MTKPATAWKPLNGSGEISLADFSLLTEAGDTLVTESLDTLVSESLTIDIKADTDWTGETKNSSTWAEIGELTINIGEERITESGETRVTENSITRVLEDVIISRKAATDWTQNDD